ncbi:hypothetical protein Tco_0111186 [Tanacetum coccineum]
MRQYEYVKSRMLPYHIEKAWEEDLYLKSCFLKILKEERQWNQPRKNGRSSSLRNLTEITSLTCPSTRSNPLTAYRPSPVMAILVISISSDSSEDSVGTPAGRTIPASLDYSPASNLESDPSEDPSSDHIPPLPAISPFLSSDDDTTDSDTPDTPISPTHDTPFTEITASTQRSPIHTSSSSYDSITWTAILPWSTASSDFHSDASSDPSLRHPLSDHSLPDLPSTYARPSSKRRRSPMTSVPALSPVSGALSPYALRDRGIDARVVVEAVDRDETETGVRGLVKVRVERVTHPVTPEDIPEPAQVGAVEVAYETLGDLVQRFHDHTQAIPVHRIQAIEEV